MNQEPTHELKWTGAIATRHLNRMIGPGKTILVTATHAVVMHGQKNWHCPDIEKAKRELNPAKTVSIEPNVSIGAAAKDQEPIVPTVPEPDVPADSTPASTASANAAAVDTVLDASAAETPVDSETEKEPEQVLPYPCTKCEEKFPSKRKLQAHMNSIHSANASTSLV